MKPFLLKAPCKDYIWGGQKLRDFGKHSDADRIAESWELSCHPDGESVIASGEYEGMTLAAYLKEHPESPGENCRRFDSFPVLVKLIDAQDRLSVQVHPDDAYALEHEGGCGKTEMWYVIAAEPDAELICGFREPVTKEEFRRAIEENTLLDKLRHVPVKSGDVFFIPSGTLHAIGKGILIAEIQQNSNTTYRVSDYGRLGADGKPRELHIAKALDVTDLNVTPPYHAGAPVVTEAYTAAELAACSCFCVRHYEIRTAVRLPENERSFQHLLVIDGACVMHCAAQTLTLNKGTSVFVPAGAGAIDMQGKCTVIQTLEF